MSDCKRRQIAGDQTMQSVNSTDPPATDVRVFGAAAIRVQGVDFISWNALTPVDLTLHNNRGANGYARNQHPVRFVQG